MIWFASIIVSGSTVVVVMKLKENAPGCIIIHILQRAYLRGASTSPVFNPVAYISIAIMLNKRVTVECVHSVH